MKKYKLLIKDTFTIGKHTLYRIQATKDFGDVTKGTLGGYIEKEKNLSHEENAWVRENAIVHGNAWVHENALVYGNAWVGGNAEVYGNVRVCGNAWVCGDVTIYGDAEVNGDARVYDNAMVYGNARVYGDAWVHGNARVHGNSRVHGSARVRGNTLVYGNAMVYGNDDKTPLDKKGDLDCIKDKVDFDIVTRPKHYNLHQSGIECIQITEHMDFCLGNAIKYIWRSSLKNGKEDIEKAIWYLNRKLTSIDK